MEFKEFGIHNEKKALLIHGGWVSWRTLGGQIEALEKEYHVYVPLLDGHNINDHSELESIELEASRIIDYFTQKHIDKVEILYGVSLGADIALEIMCQANHFAKYAFIESGALDIHKLAGWLLTHISKIAIYQSVRGHILWKKVLDSFLVQLKMPKSLYTDTKQLIKHMSKKTVKNVQKLVCTYSLKESIRHISTHCLIVYTSKEKYLVKPYKRMQGMVKNMDIICLEGYNHGQLSVGEPKKQIRMLEHFINKKHPID